MKNGVLALLVIVLGMVTPGADLPHRPPAVSGQWYAGTADALRQQVTGLIDQAKPQTAGKEEPVVALIVPHAGYAYSGPTAAAAYVNIKSGSWNRVIILAPSHYAAFHGVSIAPVSAYDTPLGPVRLDRSTCDQLLKNNLISSIPGAHTTEHSIESQLPFLQVLQPKARIVPLLIGSLGINEIKRLSKILTPLMTPDTLLVVSSDFTHFGPSFNFTPFRQDIPEKLREWNIYAARAITDLDQNRFLAHLRQTGDTICGRIPIAVAMDILKELSRKEHITGKMTDYKTSGQLTGNWTNTVSYVSIVFRDPPLPPTARGAGDTPEGKKMTSFSLTPTEKKTLLSLARHALSTYLTTGRMWQPQPETLSLTPTLKTPCGAFVTLNEHGQLRGCIGYIVPLKPLYEAVIEMAVNAAVRDPRFKPVTARELSDLEIEISVLSPLERCTDLNRITIGRDGLYIRKGNYAGLLLPQVATEWHWDRKEFLRRVCEKAGLPPHAYIDPEAVLYTFTAEVFHEGK